MEQMQDICRGSVGPLERTEESATRPNSRIWQNHAHYSWDMNIHDVVEPSDIFFQQHWEEYYFLEKKTIAFLPEVLMNRIE